MGAFLFKERWPRGRRRLTRNQLFSLSGTGGSNPSLSATLRSSSFGWRATGPATEVVRARSVLRSSFRSVGGCPSMEKIGSRMWYVYFLELSDGSIYVGSTNDLKRRINSHQQGEVQSTKAYTPIKLKSYTAVETEKTARELEIYFKSGSGKAIAKKRFW